MPQIYVMANIHLGFKVQETIQIAKICHMK